MTKRPSPDTPGVCIIVENNTVPPDTRVWREAKTLKAAGYRVSVICPKGRGFDASHETLDGIEIYRHRNLQASHALGYLVEYTWALIIEFLLAIRIYMRSRFQIIQGCNPPDTIFIIALFFKLFGVRYIFDQHDPVPELSKSRFGSNKILYYVSIILERLSFRVADVVIVTNQSCKESALSRGGVPDEKCLVVRNCPRLTDFPSRPPQRDLKEGREYLVVYVGIMGPQDGIDHLVASIDYLVNEKGRKDTQFVLIGDGSSVAPMQARIRKLGLDSYIQFTGPRYGNELRAYLATADVAVSPDPPNVFNHKVTMIKIFEYMACAIPVVLYDLAEGRRSSRGAALYAQNGDPRDFGDKIADLLDSRQLRDQLGSTGRKIIHDSMNWEAEEQVLLNAYDLGCAELPYSRRAVMAGPSTVAGSSSST